MSCHSPEIITISDSDDEVSLDLFDSTAEEDAGPEDHPDSDDVFSSVDSDSEKEGIKRISTPRRRFSRAVDRKGNGGVHCNGDIQCSSSIITSLQRNHITTPTKGSKVKSSPWTNRHMNNIAKKFEERGKVIEELARNDENFFTVFHGNDLDYSQEKREAMLMDGAVIRKKADRAKLQGVACSTSKAYFDALGLSPESKERRINEVSRVRVVAQRMPSTPENYWEVGFPSESEQRRRGLIKEVRMKAKNGRNLFQEK